MLAESYKCEIVQGQSWVQVVGTGGERCFFSSGFVKSQSEGAGERALVALPEDWCSVPSTHMVGHTLSVLLIRPSVLFWPP